MSRKKSPQLGIIFNTGQRIRKIRGTLTQVEFGKLLGVRGNTVSRWEAGRLSDLETLNKIANYGGVTVEWILRGEEPAATKYSIRTREHTPEEYSAALTDIETALLTEVVTVVHQVVAARRLKFTPAQIARLIVKAYDDSRAAHERPTAYQVERLLLFVD
jgi:transcriptional regulator with XRE-family HTH domain